MKQNCSFVSKPMHAFITDFIIYVKRCKIHSNNVQVAVNLKIFKLSGTYLKRKAFQYLISGVLCLFVFVVIFLTTDPKLPFYFDLGRYDTIRVLAMIFPLIGVLVFYRQHRCYQRGFEGEKQVTKVLSSTLDGALRLSNSTFLLVKTTTA